MPQADWSIGMYRSYQSRPKDQTGKYNKVCGLLFGELASWILKEGNNRC